MKRLSLVLVVVLTLGCASSGLTKFPERPSVERRIAAESDFAAAQISDALELLKAVDLNAQIAINKVKLKSAMSHLAQASSLSASALSKITSVKSAQKALHEFKLESTTDDVVELIGEAMVTLDAALPELESQARVEAVKKEEREIESRRKAAEAQRLLGGLLGGALSVFIGSESDKSRQKWLSENPLQTQTGIVCESNNYRRFECGTNLYIEEIAIEQTYSKRECIYGNTYGFSGRSIIVQSGCRAKFKVWGRTSPPPAEHKNAALERMKNILAQ